MIADCSASRIAPSRAHSCSRSASCSSAATASPTANATFSVPGRRPRSCEPPWKSGSNGVPRRMYIAPMPLGAPILWPLSDSRSMGSTVASMTSLPNACTASVCINAPTLRACAPIAGTSCTTPLSLLIHITEQTATCASTSVVSDSGTIKPSVPIVSRRSSPPSRAIWCTTSSTALCSVGLVTTALRPCSRRMRHGPMIARLSPSVPPDVKTISSGCALRQAAMRDLASSSAVRASRPQRCTLDGLPKRAPKNGVIASSTSERTGVVAA